MVWPSTSNVYNYNTTSFNYLPTFPNSFRLLCASDNCIDDHCPMIHQTKTTRLERAFTDGPQPVENNARKYTTKKEHYQQIPQRVLLWCLQSQTHKHVKTPKQGQMSSHPAPLQRPYLVASWGNCEDANS